MHIKKERRCVACRQSKQQQDMIRFACVNDNIVMDKLNKLGGRGAYVCKNSECIALTVKKRALNRAFKRNVDSSIYEVLANYEQNN